MYAYPRPGLTEVSVAIVASQASLLKNHHKQRKENSLSSSRLKEKGRVFREAFLAKLALLLKGTVQAPPDRFGETLADEHIRGGGLLLIHINTIPCNARRCNVLDVPVSTGNEKSGLWLLQSCGVTPIFVYIC